MRIEKNDVDMRTALCDTLMELSETNQEIVWLDADLMASSGMKRYQKAFPDRAIDCGIQESNMLGVAAGLSAEGLVPFVHSFAPFASRRIADQIFVSGVYARQNLRIVGSDPGISACSNGGTHISLEDVGILRSLPGTVILDPCDAVQLTQVVRQSVLKRGIYYIRLTRKSKFRFYEPSRSFSIGRAATAAEGSDLTLITAGAVCMAEAFKAADILGKKGISVRILDMFTLKPLDVEAVLKAAGDTGTVLTLENHNVMNGLGSAVAEVLAENRCDVTFRRMGVPDCAGEVGTVDYLLEKYQMSTACVAETALELLNMKNRVV